MTSTTEDVVFPRPLTADGQPDPLLRQMVSTTPVIRVIGPSGGRAWLVGGDKEAREALYDPARFTSVQDPSLDERAKSAAPMVGMDPPEHTRLRKLTVKAFSARRIAAMVPGIERLVASLLDDMEAAAPSTDLAAALALPLPMAVISQVLGVPEEERADLRRLSDIFTSLNDNTPEEIGAAVTEFHACLTRLVADRRSALGEDLLSDLIRARDGRDALSEDELIATVGLLIVAGHETTAKAIIRGVVALMHSRQWHRLVSGEVQVSQVVEEVLRHQTPVDTAIWRTAKVDTELGGMRIKAGDPVYVSLHLANFDPASRSDPQTFAPDRPDQGHLAFGHGAHLCLGAALARAELVAAFKGLATRFPDLRLAVPIEDLEWTVGSMLNAPTALPVTW